MDVELSIVFPVYNEADSIAELYRRTRKVLMDLGRSWEIVFVDDGSRDNSVAVLKREAGDDPRVRLVLLRRNFGQTPALAAGFDEARGRTIIAMDADLQHHPEEIPRFVAKIDEGYDLVSGWREKRVDNFWVRRIPSLVANRLMRWLSGVEIHDFGTTFKAYRSELIKEIRLYGELHRFIPALASSVGAKITELPIQNVNRPFGKSNYGIGRTVRVLFDLLTVRFLLRYLHRPLQFFGLLGLICFAMGFVLGLYILWDKFARGMDIMAFHGPLVLLTVLLVIVSVSFVSMGLLGEVLARIYFEASGKRIYHVREIWRGGAGRP
ncbi:MAG: glycosyltransferase family 2 protein [Phycisphaerae bacterium]|nr:glycosyltransferase family 2 protein [Phycisphaerae bacterium]